MDTEIKQEKRSHADEALDLLCQKVLSNNQFVNDLLKRLSPVLPPGGPGKDKEDEGDESELSPLIHRIREQSKILNKTNSILSDILSVLQI